MKIQRFNENAISSSKFKEGDYVKYLYDKIDTYILSQDDFFIVKNVILDGGTYFYKIIKIDKYFNFITIDNLDINQKNIELYYPTEKQKNEVEIKLNTLKYNL